MDKGQLSTEYLVILAVVVIVALIVVTVLGGFIDIGAGAGIQASKSYWRGAEMGILNWKVVESGVSYFTIRNNQDYTIVISSMTVGNPGVVVTEAANLVLLVGKTETVKRDLGSACVADQPYALEVAFVFDDRDNAITGIEFTGTKKIEGICG